jgi:hypothetical protein
LANHVVDDDHAHWHACKANHALRSQNGLMGVGCRHDNGDTLKRMVTEVTQEAICMSFDDFKKHSASFMND